MVKIDIKDKKILYHLHKDARQTLTQIGKKVSLQKNVVSYRLNRLVSEGVIKNFSTVIDMNKLGYIIIRIHYKFQNISPEIEKEIVNNFTNNSNTVLVATTHGLFNLKVIIIIKDINKFYKLWQETQKKYGLYIQRKSTAIFINEYYYGPYYLLDFDKKEQRNIISKTGRGSIYKIDELDYKLLQLLSANARESINKIANKLTVSTTTISSRILKLKKAGVIRGFRVNIDPSSYGYNTYKAYLYLTDYNKRNKIVEYLKNNPNLVFVDTYAGEADLDLEFHFANISNFLKSMQDLKTIFPKSIKNFEYMYILKYHKFLYMPEKW
jgi:DNA-binding Lrp family transcriptional regulator